MRSTNQMVLLKHLNKVSKPTVILECEITFKSPQSTVTSFEFQQKVDVAFFTEEKDDKAWFFSPAKLSSVIREFIEASNSGVWIVLSIKPTGKVKKRSRSIHLLATKDKQVVANWKKTANESSDEDEEFRPETEK